ncbi:MAG: alpha-ketoacid dehydrogenase subunit beta [Myxococcales bacterium]|nr:alpha-ketoacid dehydrogenase subunit beta [Myxococcales bacterium]
MSELTMVEALRSGMREAMHADASVVLLGEDVGRVGGVFRVSDGLRDEFGPARVIDTPLSEGGIVGTAIGMAMHGLRPIAEIQFADFIYPAFDQLVNEAAKIRYRSGGQFSVPLVVRAPYGGGIKGGHYHSQSPEAYFTHTAGLKVVCPSNPRDAKGLLRAAIDDPDPVIFFEPKRIYRAVRDEVPDEIRVPLGKAEIVREGADVTLIAYGAMLYEALAAAEEVAREGIEVELVDLRTLIPLDLETLEASVNKTGRFVVVHEAPLTSGFGAEIVSRLTERCFYALEAPPIRVTGFDTPFPYTLEDVYLPLARRIAPALRKAMED